MSAPLVIIVVWLQTSSGHIQGLACQDTDGGLLKKLSSGQVAEPSRFCTTLNYFALGKQAPRLIRYLIFFGSPPPVSWQAKLGSSQLAAVW